MAILAHDGKWRVSVNGQIDAVFNTRKDAEEFASSMQKQEFDVCVYYSPKILNLKDEREKFEQYIREKYDSNANFTFNEGIESYVSDNDIQLMWCGWFRRAERIYEDESEEND